MHCSMLEECLQYFLRWIFSTQKLIRWFPEEYHGRYVSLYHGVENSGARTTVF